MFSRWQLPEINTPWRIALVSTCSVVVVAAVLAVVVSCSRADADQPNLAGQTLIYQYEDGDQYRVDFKSPNALKWTALEGDEKGTAAYQQYSATPVDDDIWFIEWVEDSGVVVSQVVNLNNETVTAHVIMPDKAQSKVNSVYARKGQVAAE